MNNATNIWEAPVGQTTAPSQHSPRSRALVIAPVMANRSGETLSCMGKGPPKPAHNTSNSKVWVCAGSMCTKSLPRILRRHGSSGNVGNQDAQMGNRLFLCFGFWSWRSFIGAALGPCSPDLALDDHSGLPIDAFVHAPSSFGPWTREMTASRNNYSSVIALSVGAPKYSHQFSDFFALL